MTDTRQALEEAWNVIHPFNDPASDCSFPKACRKCDRFRRFLDVEAWTDAAMMLVQPLIEAGWTGELGLLGTVKLRHPTDRRKDVNAVNHMEPALALAQASLKARENGDA